MRAENVFVVKQTEDSWNEIISIGCKVGKVHICKNRLLYFLWNRWVKYNLPFQHIWYNKELKDRPEDNILVLEPYTTGKFMQWLRKYNRGKRIIYVYLNIIRTTISPESFLNIVEVCTWDKRDAKRYNLKIVKGMYWPRYDLQTECDKEYDITFIGCDKGRLEELLYLEEKFKALGFKTYFHIVADHGYQREREGYTYKKAISYEELLDITVKSKAIIEIVQNGQVGTTFRTMESIFYDVKLISNNVDLVNYDFYDKNNIFILGKDDMSKFKEFMELPYKKVRDDIKESYTFKSMIESL